MNDLKKVANYSDKLGSLLEAIGGVASIFKPAVGLPVVLASKALKKVSEIDDDVAKNEIFGLSASAMELDFLISEFESTGKLDTERLKILSENIKVIDSSLDKFYKIIS